MTRLTSLALLGLLALLALAGCRREEAAAPAAAPDDPVAAVEALAMRLRANDLTGFTRLSVPPELYADMARRWTDKQASEPAPSAEQRREFAETMARLTAPDAETALYAEFEPKLVKLEGELATQLPMMVGMGKGFVLAGIQASEELSATQKQHAGEVVNALADWARSAPFTDREKAKEAIAVSAATARKLQITDLEQVRTLEFEPALEKGGLLMAGLREVLALYGFDSEAAFASLKAEEIAREGDTARVRVSYTLLGRPQAYETEMVRRDGRWYSAEAIRDLERELAEPATTPAEPPVAAPEATRTHAGTPAPSAG